MDGSTVRIGLLGCGNVGSALVGLVAGQADTIAARTGLRLEITRVVVRDLTRVRGVDLAPGVLSDDLATVVSGPDVDVVVELMGGTEPARKAVLEALGNGKPVVTANKELVAADGAELFAAAESAGVDLLFEAAVAGGIPLIRPLRESLAGDTIRRVVGIVNGTTNHILTEMSELGASYAESLAGAQALGFAEADPTADVEGHDAAAKIAILATIAFGVSVVAADVSREGITDLTPDDIAAAHRLGCEIKLLAMAERHDGAGGPSGLPDVSVRVHPAMVARAHPLASVRGGFNAVFIEGDAVGELMLYGPGAGGGPTATAVLGDLIDAATNLRKGVHASMGRLPRATIVPLAEARSAFYLDMDVADRPGVLHAIAGVLADHGVSIRSMEQQGKGDEARLIFITHVTTEAALRATLDALGGLEVVDRIARVLRVVGVDER